MLQIPQAGAYFSLFMVAVLIQKAFGTAQILQAALLQANKFNFVALFTMVLTKFTIITF